MDPSSSRWRAFGAGSALLLGIVLVFSPLSARGAVGVPKILNHQGRLLNSSGDLLGGSGTDFCFKFSFYSDATVGSPDTKVWPSGDPSTMTASVKNGVFNAGIGDTVAGGDTLNFNFQDNDAVYLNVEVATRAGATCAPGDGAESFENLAPRQRILASGYSINAATVGGFTPSQSPTDSNIPVLTSGNLIFGGAATIDSTSTNALSIGTNANAKTITIGNSTGATGLVFTKGGSGAITFTGFTSCTALETNESGVLVCGSDEGGSGGGTVATQENDATIVSTTTVLDFLGTDFAVTLEGSNEANVAIDYASSTVTRASQPETVTGAWVFNTTTTLTAITIGGDTINEFVGTGLVLSGNSLTAALGTAIDTSEITDGTITGDDINSNIAGGGLVLTAGSPDVLDIGAGFGITVNASDIAIATSTNITWGGTHTFNATTTHATTSIVTLIIGGDTLTELIGTGLALSGSTLTTTLGTAVDTSEITDGTVTGDDINSNIAGGGLVLTAGSPDILDIGAGFGITVNASDIAIATSTNITWGGTHVFATTTLATTTINTQLTIGGDTITDFVGTGLAMSGTILTTTLGTAIDTSEITDGTITGDDINSNIGGAGLVLTAGSPDVLDIGAGFGITVNANDIAITTSTNFTWSGTHTFNATTTHATSSITSLVIGGDTFDELVGTGLQVSSGDLQTVLGTTIETGEITDGTITGDDVNANIGGAGLVLTAASPDTLDIDLLDANDSTGATFSQSGLEFQGAGSDELTLLQGCAANDVLKWSEANSRWECQADVSGGTPTLDSVSAATADGAERNSSVNTVNWNWNFSSAAVDTGLDISENVASTLGTQGQQTLLELTTLSGSTASPLQITSNSADVGDIFIDLNSLGDFEIRDAGTAFVTFTDAGAVTLAGHLTLSGDANEGLSGGGLADCDASTQRLQWDVTTNKFSCLTVSGGGSDLQHAATYDTTEALTNITSVEVEVAQVDITPTTATGDVYVRAVFEVLSGNATDQSLVINIENGNTACAGTVLETNTLTVSSAAGIIIGVFEIADVVVDAGASAQSYELCMSTATGDTDIRTYSMFATVIDTGADLAEIYTTNDETIEPGDVVSLDSTLKTGVQKSQQAYDPTVLGIVSTMPGLLIGNVNKEGVGAKAVALTGRVPVKVSTEGGEIKPGDLLTSSHFPGIAMKAAKAGPIIGQALTGYQGEGIGTVMAFAITGYSHGASLTSLLKGLTEESSEPNSTSTNFGKQVLGYLFTQKEQLTASSTPSEIFTDRLAAGLEIISPRGLFDGLEVNTIGALGDAVTFTSDTIFFGRPYFNSDTGGFAIIAGGEQAVEIVFEREYLEPPVVNVTPGGEPATLEGLHYAVAEKDVKGFTILLNRAAPADITFNWTALAVKNPKVFGAPSSPVSEAVAVVQEAPPVTEVAAESEPAADEPTSENDQPDGVPPAEDSPQVEETALPPPETEESAPPEEAESEAPAASEPEPEPPSPTE